ncbi:hypothetical protein EV284_6355 [Streptomyces sp. BK022]|uniref:hypothetical protein n=1 Tax=Streptomyces sp. BK022 TaxID=2512123 RepID=UPI001029A30F|nr:hypothetical protein [Streptomyces sp. BK022]RZU28189.1 hypothetical protein EV284_6355 [Streptomyces sp. BK022]
MAIPTSTITPVLASDISDRAFRLYVVLALRPDNDWISCQDVATAVGMKSHEIRMPLAELRRVGLAERERRYERHSKNRKTWHTYVRLLPASTTSEAAA